MTLILANNSAGASGGSGDVSYISGGPSVADNSIARFHSTTGTIIQGATNGPTIDDAGAVTIGAGGLSVTGTSLLIGAVTMSSDLDVGNLTLGSNGGDGLITGKDTNDSVYIQGDGTGYVYLDKTIVNNQLYFGNTGADINAGLRLANISGAIEATIDNKGIGSMYYDTDNDAIRVYDGTSWSSVGGTPATLGEIGNVTITSNSSGEILKWNGSAWINNTLAEAGIAAASHTHTLADITDVTSTAAEVNYLDGATVGNGRIIYANGTNFTGEDAFTFTTAGNTLQVGTISEAGDVWAHGALQVGLTTKVQLKNSSGELQVRNNADSDYADLRVGNLYVEGITTKINSETFSVADNVVELNNNVTGTPTEDAGIEVVRGTSTNASILWDETADVWKAGIAGSEVEISLLGHTHTLSDITDLTDTDDLTEGSTNLYYTDERVDDRVNALFTDGAGVTSTYDDGAGTLTVDVDHDATNNFVANEHIDHTSVTLTAGEGLAGGGTIAANRTFDLDINSLTEFTGIDLAADFILYYDTTATEHKKISWNDLQSAARSGVGDGEIIFYDSTTSTKENSESNFVYDKATNKLYLSDSATADVAGQFNLVTSASNNGVNVVSAASYTGDYFVAKNSALTELFKVDDTGGAYFAGDVGIGIAPTRALHVEKSQSSGFLAYFDNTHASGNGLQVITTSTGSGEVAFDVNSDDFVVRADGRVRINHATSTLGHVEITADYDTMTAAGHDHACPIWTHADYAQGQNVIDGRTAGSDLAWVCQENNDVDNSAQSWFGTFKNGVYGPTDTAGVVSSKTGTGVTKDLVLIANDSAGGTPQVTAKANTEFVGINNAAPAAGLDIVTSSGSVPLYVKQNAATSADPTLATFYTSTGWTGQFAATDEPGESAFMVATNASHGFGVYVNNTTTTPDFYVKSDGNVGIGTSTPSQTLDVAGTGAFSGDVTVPDEVYGAGWNGSLEVPTKNAIYDKIESLGGSGTMTTVKEGGTQVGGADIVTLDFDGDDFNLTESPDTEVNITINDGGIDHGSIAGLSDDDHTQYSLISSQAGAPTSTPSRVGEVNVDTTSDNAYISTGTVSSADWTLVNDDTTLTQEAIEDYVGGMVTGNTETLITVTYQDGDGTLDFVVDNDLANYSNATSAFITASSTDTLTNKSGNISQWTNDSGYITATLTQEQVEDYAGSLISAGTGTHTGITVTYQDATGDVDFVVDHDAATNFVANEHIDHTAVTLTAGEGLSGGGDISTSRTFDIDISPQTDIGTPAAGDVLLIEDITDGSIKKVQASEFLGGGGGETNTASNVGTAGVGVFKQKTGVDLEFKKINAGSSKVTITDDTGNSEIDIDVAEANIDHDALTNFVANEHIDWTQASAGTIHATNYTDTNTQLSQEQVEDFAGAMIATGGTKTGITVTYQDSTNDMDFVVDTASTTTAGIVELTTIAEVDAGTDTTRAVTADALHGSTRNLKHLVYRLVASDTDVATGTSIGGDFRMPFSGSFVQDDSNVYQFMASTDTAGTTGTMVVDINKGGTTIMTTNKLDIESAEKTTGTAATQPDVTTTTFSAGDIITFDVDAIHTTAAKGLTIHIAVRPD